MYFKHHYYYSTHHHAVFTESIPVPELEDQCDFRNYITITDLHTSTQNQQPSKIE